MHGIIGITQFMSCTALLIQHWSSACCQCVASSLWPCSYVHHPFTHCGMECSSADCKALNSSTNHVPNRCWFCCRFSKTQLAGCMLITLGVMFAAAPPAVLQSLGVIAGGAAGDVAVEAITHVDMRYVATCVLCFAFPAMASIIKVSMLYTRATHVCNKWLMCNFGSVCCTQTAHKSMCGTAHYAIMLIRPIQRSCSYGLVVR
jgi:hypothetical protein